MEEAPVEALTKIPEPVIRCCVPNCDSNSTKGIPTLRFFPFPNDIILACRWEIQCNIKRPFGREEDRICCRHFRYDDFTNIVLATQIKENCVPSLYLKLNPKVEGIEVLGPTPAQIIRPIPVIKREEIELIEDAERVKERERLRILQTTVIDGNPLRNGAPNNLNVMTSSQCDSSQARIQGTFFSFPMEEGMEISYEDHPFLMDTTEETYHLF